MSVGAEFIVKPASRIICFLDTCVEITKDNRSYWRIALTVLFFIENILFYLPALIDSVFTRFEIEVKVN